MTTDPDGKPYAHNEEQAEAAKCGRMILPTTQPTHADIAWYVRECTELRENWRVATTCHDRASSRARYLENMLIRADAALETLGVGKLAPVRVNIAHALSLPNDAMSHERSELAP